CITRAALIWFFMGGEPSSVIVVAAIYVFLQIISLGVGYGLVRKQLPLLRLGRRYLDRAVLIRMLRFSLFAFILTIATYLRFGADTLIIGFFLGPVSVGYYAVGTLIPEQLRAALSGLTMVYVPLATQMNALDKSHSLRKLLVVGSRAAFLLVL